MNHFNLKLSSKETLNRLFLKPFGRVFFFVSACTKHFFLKNHTDFCMTDSFQKCPFQNRFLAFQS